MTFSLGKLFLAIAVVLFIVAALGVGEVVTLATIPLGLASLALGHMFP